MQFYSSVILWISIWTQNTNTQLLSKHDANPKNDRICLISSINSNFREKNGQVCSKNEQSNRFGEWDRGKFRKLIRPCLTRVQRKDSVVKDTDKPLNKSSISQKSDMICLENTLRKLPLSILWWILKINAHFHPSVGEVSKLCYKA